MSHLVTPPGFEPRQTESESVVLPLYYGALKTQMYHFIYYFFSLVDVQKDSNPFSLSFNI